MFTTSGHVTRTGASPPPDADQWAPRRLDRTSRARGRLHSSPRSSRCSDFWETSHPARLWPETKSHLPRFVLWQLHQRRVRTACQRRHVIPAGGRRVPVSRVLPGGGEGGGGRRAFFHCTVDAAHCPVRLPEDSSGLPLAVRNHNKGRRTVNVDVSLGGGDVKTLPDILNGFGVFVRRGLTSVRHAGRVRSGAVRKTQQWGFQRDGSPLCDGTAWSRAEASTAGTGLVRVF